MARGVLFLCLGILLTGVAGCRSMLPNRPIRASGPSFERSFHAASAALALKGYQIAEADTEARRIVTVRRHNGGWWWYISAEVSEQGEVDFYVVGSHHVMREGRIHPRLLGYGRRVKQIFDRILAAHDGPQAHAHARAPVPLRRARGQHGPRRHEGSMKEYEGGPW